VECPELIPAMAGANILRVSVGVETLDPEVREIINKKIDIKTYQEAFRRMRDHGIFSVASFIIGIPGERREARARALDLAIKSGCDSAHFLPFFPFPGIPLQSDQTEYAVSPEDSKDANLFTAQFMQSKTVQRQLRKAMNNGGIRGMLAGAALKRRLKELAPN
jgi:radical SAM superfamily enzyme YgiQ (UPF0313 family)